MELRHHVIRPSLKQTGLWSLAAENLLLGTAACESELGARIPYRNQQALGIYQISPRRHKNLWDNYLASQPDLSSRVRGLASQREFLQHPHHELATNLAYATVIAGLLYYRGAAAIDRIAPTDILSLGKLWCRHFHNQRTKSHPPVHFVNCYQRLILTPETI